MYKTITLPLWNRPEYTKKALKSLVKCNMKDYELISGLEPGYSAILDIVNNFAKKKTLPGKMLLNKKKLGVNYSNFCLYKRAFDSGSEFNVAMEDDIVLGPDALDFAIDRFIDKQKLKCLSPIFCALKISAEKKETITILIYLTCTSHQTSYMQINITIEIIR